MKRKLFLYLMIILTAFTLAGCDNNKKKNKSVEKEKVNQEEIIGIYFNDNDKTDFIELKKDGTFNRQSNYCEGISSFDGKYEVINYKGKSAIKVKYTLIGTGKKSTEYLILKDDEIHYFEEGKEENMILFGCSEGVYKKGTENDIKRIENTDTYDVSNSMIYSAMYSYQDYITNIASKEDDGYILSKYALVDIDKDKMPELFLSYEDDSYRGSIKFYKYLDNKVSYLGESELNNSVFSNSKNKYLLKSHARQGAYSYSTIEIKNNKIKEKVIDKYSELKDNGASYDDYSEREDKFYNDSGSSDITFYDINDMGGFDKYSG